MAAQSLGYKVAVIDPGDHSPAGSVADRHIRTGYLDPQGLAELAALACAVTTEFENVPAAALEFLARTARVMPSAASVAIAQDRIAEKAFLSACGVAVAPYAVLREDADAPSADPALLPGIVKSARLGYDGKGQARVAGRVQAAAAFREFGAVPCVLEKRLDLALELSVVVARGFGGERVAYPVAENEHRGGILAVSTVPARIDEAVARRAIDTTLLIADRLDYVGVLCVEFFLLADGRLVVNEMAPRPHNSGHYTIDACVTSQFEQQVRVLAGLPLGSVHQHEPAVMLNLLGDCWFAGASVGAGSGAGAGAGEDAIREPDWSVVLRHPRAKLHLYGKSQPRRGRKMGHVTVLADTQLASVEVAATIERQLGIRA